MNDILPILFFITFPFVDNVCTLNYSPVNQPFGWEMKKSGVKTRPSEQTVLPVEADLLLGPDSSSEMDSETDDQSYSPTEVYALTWHGYTAHIMHMVSCIA